MRIIDPHVHVWQNDPAFPWAPETTNPPKEDRTPEALLELMDANGVEKTVLVQVIHYRWDNSYAAHVSEVYPDKFVGVCRVNPLDSRAAEHLSFWVEEHGFQGVRLSPGADASGDWFMEDRMDPIFRRAESLRVPLLLLTRPSRLPDLAARLERFPELDVVIDHMADCNPKDEVGIGQLLDLARFPRVYVKISHTWGISEEPYPWKDTHDLVQRVFQAYGPERIMWSTDWPVCLSHATYAQTLSAVRDEMTFFNQDDLTWVLGKSALKLWSFGEGLHKP